jgi:outer membrane lipoprotein-sorting protein
MSMRNFFSTIVLYWVSAIVLTAQSPEVLKAREILDEVSATTQAYESIKADFSFILENTQADMTDSHSGTILISNDKYKVSLMDVDSYFDGQTLWTHLKEVGEVNISNPDPMDSDMMLSPAKIFNIYKEGFRYIYAGETTIDGKKVDIIDLFPEDRDKPFSRIKLFVNKDNRHISKITQIGKDGNNYIIDIQNMKTDVPCEPSMFIFDTDEYPQVEVIDMR